MSKSSSASRRPRAHVALREVLKFTKNTTRQGQSKGQLAAVAAEHNVSESWLRLIATGTLDDPVFVQAIRDAAKDPHLWELVSPAAQEVLFLPTLKIEQLGGSRDDLLGMFLESLELLQHPGNAYYASKHTALDHVTLSLDLRLEERRYLEIARGRGNITSVKRAREKKSEDADSRAEKWLSEINGRTGTQTKGAIYLRIANRENKTLGSIKQAIRRYQKKQKTDPQTNRNSD